MSIEWHETEVDVANLNAGTVRTPIRTDVIGGPPVAIPARGNASIPLPLTAPSNAHYVVLVFDVGTDPSFSVVKTQDFLQYPMEAQVTSEAAPVAPTLSTWGTLLLALILAGTAAYELARRRKEALL